MVYLQNGFDNIVFERGNFEHDCGISIEPSFTPFKTEWGACRICQKCGSEEALFGSVSDSNKHSDIFHCFVFVIDSLLYLCRRHLPLLQP